ncbi:MAG: hydantoinase B/oxoprolinase family protein [Planctomycetes bacterium]|nr:hydantoinase B/oxoprolinase family protein [Planctomycetota bacterium]
MTSNIGAVDQVTLQVVNNHMVTTAREMGVAMKNTSYSPLFNEGLDFSCAIFDAGGEMVAQAEFCPAQLGAMPYVVEWTIQEIGQENFHPGDVVFHNDPFRGGCHLPEYCVIKPVFLQAELVCFVACIGHMTEVGGKVPGGFAGDATEVFQEGLRVPPVKIVESGRDVDAVWNIIMANVRTPRMSYGDIKAMIGSLYVGERRMLELIADLGRDRFVEVAQAIKDYGERRMRAEIAEMPDGEYEFEDIVIDNDGITDVPARLRVKVTITGERMIVDYSGSDAQRLGPVNCTYGVTASATYNALMHLTGGEIPSNHGCYRPIKIIAPPGTIVNVDYPGASVGGNSEIHPHLVMAIYGALAKALPDRVSAHDGGTSALLAIGGVHPDTGDVFANLTNEGCGWGGRATKDGNNALCIPNGNCALQPVEILETRYPILHEQLALHEGSGGAGKNRGGLGYTRQVRMAAAQTRLSTFIEKDRTAPWGLFGGGPGKKSSLTVKLANEDRFRPFTEAFGTRCPGKFSDVYLPQDAVIRLTTSGGGGYGDPLVRDFARIESDVRQGFVSREQAQEEYQVVFKGDGWQIDVEATKTWRQQSRS